jgi:nuclear protein 1
MEAHFDEYEHYNFDQDKYIYCGRSGKQRTKKEASLNTNHHDPCGHTRKTVQKLLNSHHGGRLKVTRKQ